MLSKLGLIKVASATPKVKIGNPTYNVGEIMRLTNEAASNGAKIVVFPELSVTGYTCGDLFNQSHLLNLAEKELYKICNLTGTPKANKTIVVVGMPIKVDNQLFNCGVIISNGKVQGVVPKTYMPNYNEFYEKRWFASSISRISNTITICGHKVPFNENFLLKDKNSGLCLGLDICEDLWVNIPPSSYHTLYGANIIANLSASNETIGKTSYRRDIVKVQSAKCITGYIYSSAGKTESTTDVVFSGHSMIVDNGSIQEEAVFGKNKELIYGEIDIEKIENDRVKFNSYMGNVDKRDYVIEEVLIPHYVESAVSKLETLAPHYVESKLLSFDLCKHFIKHSIKNIDPRPFVPSNLEKQTERCLEIMKIQATGLAQRLSKINCDKAVIGISGGLDSTLALLVANKAFEMNGYPKENIIGVTMPGFGTTNRTYDNAVNLMKELGVTIKDISIKRACEIHYDDIGHDINITDVTYENVQARERTQILMDLANKHNAIVVGTGDLSELALGWCTYNGDQMSMYGVNASIPKTLVSYMIRTCALMEDNSNIKRMLIDICNTPVSPELLPPKDGEIVQITEEAIGYYELHDFFLYNMLRNGFGPEKIFNMAVKAFDGDYSEEIIIDTMAKFYKRFFTQQFKRSCMPDGVKVGSICLSPRGDLRMPSDASFDIWMDIINKIKRRYK